MWSQHNSELILCCFIHDYLQQMCFCVRQCLKCYLQICTWYWVGEGCTEVWNNEILVTLYTKAPRTHRSILQYDCLLEEWCSIKYILLSVITNVCSDLIFITKNPVSLNSVEPKFTSSHIIFRNMNYETQVSLTLMKVKLLKNFYQQRHSSFVGQCSAMISNH
jgi:hypothetical protein